LGNTKFQQEGRVGTGDEGVSLYTLQQDKTLIFSKQTAGTSSAMSGSEDN